MAVNPAHPEQKKILKAFCEQEFERQRDYLIAKYQLNDYEPVLLINWRTTALANEGGVLTSGEPYIKIVAHEVCEHVGKTEKFRYEEYDFLAKKEGIGNGEANWQQYLAWTIAHELAHTIVEHPKFVAQVDPQFPPHISLDRRAHGKLWQSIYRELRVNYCIEDRYQVESIDFAKHVHFGVTNGHVKGEKHFTFFRGNKPIGWYIKHKGTFYRSTKNWMTRKPTNYRKPAEITKRLVSV